NLVSIFFFFSSRRRHTRFSRDWSSDVCSSDLPVKKVLRNRPHHQVGIVGRSNRLMRMEEVSFIRSWSLLTSIALRNHHTPERTLVGVHQGDVAQACKSGLSRDPFTLLSGCQEGSRVQLRRSTPVACGDGSAPVVLAKLNRPLDIRRSRADTGQYESCSDRHRIRSSRVPEI